MPNDQFVNDHDGIEPTSSLTAVAVELPGPGGHEAGGGRDGLMGVKRLMVRFRAET